MTPALAILYHDPAGKLDSAVAACLPLLRDIYAGIAVCASPQAHQGVMDRWAAAGALIDIQPPRDELPIYFLGDARRCVVTLALETGTDYVHYCDGDRILHWAQHYPEELRQTVQRINEADFVMLGRSQRAFDTHPAVQRDTERIICDVFRRITGLDWDIGSGSRSLSRRAIDYLNLHCHDETIAVDVTWPLCLRDAPDLTMAYWTVEGMEFESGDGYDHEMADPAHYTAWLDSLDADPQRWAYRLKVAQLEVAQMAAYCQKA